MADETPAPAAEDAAPSAAATFGGGTSSDSGSAAERVLNQDEIDSLLGFDVGADSAQDKSGVRAIINSALVSYERLPMLEVVFDRLVRLMTTSLRNFTSDNVECQLDAIQSMRFRRLSQLDPAAGHSRRVQGQAARQFRPADG
jgi:flagellar motor switch protein FliM